MCSDIFDMKILCTIYQTLLEATASPASPVLRVLGLLRVRPDSLVYVIHILSRS